MKFGMKLQITIHIINNIINNIKNISVHGSIFKRTKCIWGCEFLYVPYHFETLENVAKINKFFFVVLGEKNIFPF